VRKPDEWVIETRDLGKSYGNIAALKSLNLKVPCNSIFGFLGPNGAGKTTAMKLLLGLAKPSFGTGKIFGLDIVHDSVQIRQRIGYLAQHPQFPKQKTVREILDFSLRFFIRDSKPKADQRISEMLKIVGLSDKANRLVGNLSGGELQRLGLAQAQINDPELLILDEPAASLDPIGRDDVLQIMKRQSKKSTIFYSTHILDDVQNVSDTVAILNHGEQIAQDSIKTLLSGSGSTIYEIILKGESEVAFAEIIKQTWISKIETLKTEKETKWLITVKDDETAEKKLLREILSHKAVDVLDFRKKKFELEEVFIKLVKGADENDRTK